MEKEYFQDGENYAIKQDKVVKVIKYKATSSIEIVDTSNKTNGFKNITKISKGEYYDARENAIKKYCLVEKKTNESLKKSMKNLERKIRNNFTGANNELFITLTTREMTNIADIEKYFDEFWNRLKSVYQDLEYVYVIERNSIRESWHLHLLVKATEHKTLYIPNSTIEELWQKGYTKTSRITDKVVYNDINEKEHMIYVEKKLMSDEIVGIEKVIKYMTKIHTKQGLPKGMKCYNTSRELKMPKIKKVEYCKICDEMNSEYYLEKEKTTLVRDVETDAILNKIKKEIWIKDKN